MNDATAQKTGSNVARAQAARLAAVQALYEYTQNQRDLKSIASDYAAQNQPVGPEGVVTPDGELLRKILSGSVDRFDELSGIVKANWNPKSDLEKDIEPLLKSILICGTYEIMAHQDIDFPIIINDYVNAAHAFYSPSEAKLVNAILDKIARLLRA